MDGGPKQTIFQEDIQMANNTQKDAQHHSLLEKWNQNYNEVSAHINHNDHHKKIYRE